MQKVIPLKIGLTGGIGSGKTTVAALFELLGIPVYYADHEAKRLMNEDASLKEQITIHFGAGAYRDGHLDRKHLASLVFANKEKLALLNSLVHPVTIQHSQTWAERHVSPYIIREAALIFESGVNEVLDYVIGVSAPEQVRIQRVMQRDNISVDAVKERMNNQWDEEEKLSRCDFLLFNDDRQLLIPQVINLHHHLLKLSSAAFEKEPR